MRILVINPNTTVEMTKQIERELNGIKRHDTVLQVTNPSFGPEGLASSYDEIVAGFELIKIVQAAKQEGYDAIVVACFSDPGIAAAKELCDIPVVGIAEASMHMACMLGHKFTILTTSPKRIPSKALYVRYNGIENRLASVRALGVGVVETTHKPQRTKDAILAVATRAIAEDGAEVIILGCAGMAGYGKELEERLGVPVLDPNAIALKMAEAMVDLGLRPSKAGLFAYPPTLQSSIRACR
jgi:allantoin racemase